MYKINANTKILILLFFAYAMIRVDIFYSLPWNVLSLTYDGKEYLQFSQYPLFSSPLFYSRPFLYPIFLKAAHQNLLLVEHIQLLISIGAWFFCAYVFTLLTSKTRNRRLILVCVLIYSFSEYINLWDITILSESLSISFLISFLSCVILILLNGMTFKNLSSLLFFASMLVFLRDSAVYLIIFVTIPLTLYLFTRLRYQKKRFLIMACIIPVWVGALSYESEVTANKGNRWLAPMAHVMYLRIFYSPQAEHYFVQQGMKECENNNFRPVSTFVKSNSLCTRWVTINGKNVYKNFLLSHPVYFLSPMMGASNYWSSWLQVPYRVRGYLHNGNTPNKSILILLGINDVANMLPLVLSVIFMVVFIRKGKYLRKDIIIRASICGLFLAWILSLIIWHADTAEIPRHQLETYLLFIYCLSVGTVCGVVKKK